MHPLAGLIPQNLANDTAIALPIGPVLLNAILAGIVIALAGFVLDTILAKISTVNRQDILTRMVSASNLLIVCVGVCGIMLLIEQSLVRAVVLFAAIALVRFRVRVSEKSLNASLFFAVIAGMASGLGEFRLAWIFSGLFVVIAILLSLTFKIIAPYFPSPSEPQAPENMS